MPGKFTVQRTRRMVLSLLLATVAVTAGAYLLRSQWRERNEPPPAAPIPPNIAQSEGFSLSKSDQGRTLFRLQAKRAREQRDSGKSILEEVEIVTYGAQGNRHDRIYSKLCEYDPKTGRVHSEGEVEIELASLPGEPPAAGAPPAPRPAVPAIPNAPATPIYVKTSGLSFDENTGVASTERQIEFRFSRGQGRAVGAVYDSVQRTLQLKSAVEILAADEPARAAGSPPPQAADAPATDSRLEIKATELLYQQPAGQIHLQKPELRRPLPGGGSRELAGDQATLLLDEKNQARSGEIVGNVRIHELAAGVKPDRRRETKATAGLVNFVLNERQSLDQLYLTGGVQVESATHTGRMQARAARLELFFNGPDDTLSQVEWKDGARLVLTPGTAGAPVRVVSSDVIEMFMKPGGQELGAARTLAPGRLELLPAATPGPSPTRAGRRVLTADRISMEFGDESRLRALRADKEVRLESEVLPPPAPPAPPGRPAPAPAKPTLRVTTSDVLVAQFNPQSDQLERMEQTGNFHYVEGQQQATAERAVYLAADENVTLTGRAGQNPEVWDAQTRTSAQVITLNENTGEGTAERAVRSTHQPQQQQKPGTASAVPGPLSPKDPVHVVAERMVSNSKTGLTRYEGGPGGRRARLWQNGDVIQARTILLDRGEKRLTASGEVATVLIEAGGGRPGPRATAPAAPGQAAESPRPVSISAENLVYTDQDRRARYEGQVVLRRENGTLRAAQLDAYLLPSDEVQPGQSRLERALARGQVQITEASAAGLRHAGAEVAEYLSADDKMLLSGGDPYIHDDQQGYTRGRQLTYYIHDDRIFVHGDRASRTVTERRLTKRR